VPSVLVDAPSKTASKSGPQVPDAYRGMWRVTTAEEAFAQIALPFLAHPAASISAGYDRLAARYAMRPVRRGDSGELPGERYPA
jgi:hypothetical protein